MTIPRHAPKAGENTFFYSVSLFHSVENSYKDDLGFLVDTEEPVVLNLDSQFVKGNHALVFFSPNHTA